MSRKHGQVIEAKVLEGEPGTKKRQIIAVSYWWDYGDERGVLRSTSYCEAGNRTAAEHILALLNRDSTT